MKKYILITLLFLGLVLQSKAQETKRVFFIGNSYTFYNTLPVMLNNIANSHGDTVIHASSTPGGAQLSQHVSNNTTMNGIKQGNWDFVVIQEQSQKPSFPDAQVASDVYPYAAQLNDTIEKYNPCGETAFFMTWGRQNGDPQWAPISTFEGMNWRLRNAYLQMTVDNEAICSPVGAAWKVMRDSFPTVGLYNPDGSHPSYAGTYLAACTFYATLFRKSLVGTTYYGSLSATTAQQIHQVVDRVVLDSMSNWSIGAHDINADFNSIVSNDTIIVNNQSSNATHYSWDFGDNSPIDTSTNPVHVYSMGGNYTVSLLAQDSCGHTDTLSQNITVSLATSLSKVDLVANFIQCYPNPSTGLVHIDCLESISDLRVVDMLGREILYEKNINTNKKILSLFKEKKGIYYIYINTKNYKCFVNKLVLQ